MFTCRFSLIGLCLAALFISLPLSAQGAIEIDPTNDDVKYGVDPNSSMPASWATSWNPIQGNASNNLYVGSYENGQFLISGGDDVSNMNGYLAYNDDSHGAVTVTGAGSTWTNSQSLIVGDFGTGTLSIEAGGVVSNSFSYVGSYPNA